MTLRVQMAVKVWIYFGLSGLYLKSWFTRIKFLLHWLKSKHKLCYITLIFSLLLYFSLMSEEEELLTANIRWKKELSIIGLYSGKKAHYFTHRRFLSCVNDLIFNGNTIKMIQHQIKPNHRGVYSGILLFWCLEFAWLFLYLVTDVSQQQSWNCDSPMFRIFVSALIYIQPYRARSFSTIYCQLKCTALAKVCLEWI